MEAVSTSLPQPPKKCECALDNGKIRHPLFVSMMSISADGLKAGIKLPSRICADTNPLFRVRQLNGQVPTMPIEIIETKHASDDADSDLDDNSTTTTKRRKKRRRRRKRKSNKGAPYWQLDLSIGPFETGANELKQMWIDGSRKLEGRMVAGVKFSAFVNELLQKGRETVDIRPPEGKEIVIYSRDQTELVKLLNARGSQLKQRNNKRSKKNVAQSDDSLD